MHAHSRLPPQPAMSLLGEQGAAGCCHTPRTPYFRERQRIAGCKYRRRVEAGGSTQSPAH
jgi:hypothetical protein